MIISKKKITMDKKILKPSQKAKEWDFPSNNSGNSKKNSMPKKKKNKKPRLNNKKIPPIKPKKNNISPKVIIKGLKLKKFQKKKSKTFTTKKSPSPSTKKILKRARKTL
jgi:hypothetical protein